MTDKEKGIADTKKAFNRGVLDVGEAMSKLVNDFCTNMSVEEAAKTVANWQEQSEND